MTDTIVAVSTPSGRGGIGVVRMSGEPLGIADKMFESREIAGELMPQYMYFGTVHAGGFSDKGYMVYFKSPKSYTGEDVVEFHVHGGVKIVQGIVEECIRRGARPAERGEFTRRAFLNGKMALSDAEGVIDMINADSESSVRAAYKLLSGGVTKDVKEVQSALSDVISDLEAVLDYPEELEGETLPDAKEKLVKIVERLAAPMRLQAYGRLIKYGADVAIVGETNVGKSSLLNALTGNDRAIVSSVRGTTRDTVSDSIEYKGMRLNLTDTAGLRETTDIIEKEGVNRAKNEAITADLVILLCDLKDKGKEENLPVEVEGERALRVYNKADLAKERAGAFADEKGEYFVVSAKYGDGITELLDGIVKRLSSDGNADASVMTNERQLDAVRRAYNASCDALAAYDAATTDCAIVELREAWSALGEVTGDTVSEDIINGIFEKFCVGK